MIKVIVQDGVAIGSNIGFRERLALLGVKQGKKLIFLDGVVAKNVQGTDQGLWAFLDLEDDTELGLHSFVVIDHLGFDLDLTKTVGLIKSFQVSNIRVEK